MNLTHTQKRKIAKMVASKATTMENGTIHVWINKDGVFSLTVGSWGYRDDNHTLVASINILNEHQPYTQAEIIRMLDYAIKQRESL